MKKSSRTTQALLLTCGLGVPLGVPAQDRVEPDRRDFTSSTGIVPLGKIQVEVGAAWEGGDAGRRWTVGENLVRLPLAQQVELRLGLPPYAISYSDARSSGFDDATVEARWRFYRSDALDVGLQLSARLPTGSSQVAERNLQPGALLAATSKLTEKVDLVLNVGGRRASEDGQRFGQAFAAAALRADIAPKWNVLVETYAFNREERGGSSRKYAALGAVYFIDDGTALYANVGKGIANGDDTDTLASFGLSRRF